MMSIVSSAGKRQLCSAKQISEARGSTIRRLMPRSMRCVDLFDNDNEALLASAASG
jgi:hypothetical protein